MNLRNMSGFLPANTYVENWEKTPDPSKYRATLTLGFLIKTTE